jgi:hypothetical protein
MAILSKRIYKFFMSFLGKKSEKRTEYNFFGKQFTKLQNFAQKRKTWTNKGGGERERERERERELIPKVRSSCI